MEGALIFCRIRSFLSTCRKQGIKASQALDGLFRGQLPDFPHAKIENLTKDSE
jgi:transposase